jgi:YidC/Oxa1 family membrane protein insertase
MDKKTIIAVVLTAAIWFIWFNFFDPKLQKQNEADIVTQSQTLQEKSTDAVTKSNIQIATSHNITNTKESVINLETNNFVMEFTNKGAAIQSFLIKDREVYATIDEQLFDSSGMLDFLIHFDNKEFLNGGPLDEIIWEYKINDNALTFWSQFRYNGSLVEFRKIYTLSDDSNGFKLDYVFKNLSKDNIKFPNSSVIISSAAIVGPKLDYTNTYNRIMGIYGIDGSYKEESKGSGFFSKAGMIKSNPNKTDWVGVGSRYLLAIMKPEGFYGNGILFDNREGTGYRTGMYVELGDIKPNEEITKSFKVYIGEKNKDKLSSVDPALSVAANVNRLIEPIRYFVLWCVLGLNKIFGNVGWSLVVFSIFTKLAFMPLTNKSTKSMKKMQALAPKINELKAKYKDKPQVMNQKVMEMYKENKVNPLGGCLPLILQMPFFFALYSALMNSLDLWNAPFIFWIKDLSMPDTVAVISGFHLNILPILMTITTFVQQKLSMVDSAQTNQQKMLMAMPLLFIFIFWSMPSGLVLYWTLQNVFQIINQLIVNKFGKAKT